MGEKLATAIDNLGGTLEDKLAAVEAAMKAQTLSLENKLALLEAAIKALPDYTDQLKAIEAAIKGMPDYSDKLAAIETAIKNIPDYSDKLAALETALEAIADNIEAQEGQYADELAALTESIDAIKSEVAAGNKSQEDALAEIIALLKSGAIAGGGSGGGSGGEGSGGEGSGGEGEGGEGSGDEPTGPYISFTTEKPVGSTIQIAYRDSELTKITGVENLQKIGSWDSGVPVYRGTLNSQEVKLYGTFTKFQCVGGSLTEIDTDTQGALEVIDLTSNPDLKFNFEFNTKLKVIRLIGRILSESELSDLVEKLPFSSGAVCTVDFRILGDSIAALEEKAEKKGWDLQLIYPL
jgi:phage host-nuclease inhibitor protein Gam